MIVVGDASVFIALERIGEQSLLQELYGEVHVPEAVWREIDRPNAHPPGWVIRHSLPRPLPASSWSQRLHEGEIEAIHLARELAADLLLIDEISGRVVARKLGIEVAGTVGLLIEARRRGNIPSVRPCLDKLRRSGFWLSEQVYRTALARCGENQ